MSLSLGADDAKPNLRAKFLAIKREIEWAVLKYAANGVCIPGDAFAGAACEDKLGLGDLDALLFDQRAEPGFKSRRFCPMQRRNLCKRRRAAYQKTEGARIRRILVNFLGFLCSQKVGAPEVYSVIEFFVVLSSQHAHLDRIRYHSWRKLP